MTKEQYKLCRKNEEEARRRLNVPKGYVLHHIDPTWRKNDVERYIQWNDEDLVIMERVEHQKWHMNHLPDEYREKMSKACEGEKNGFYGKKHSEESKLKMSESAKHRKKSECHHLTKVEREERKAIYEEKYKDIINCAEVARKLTEDGYPTCKATIRRWRNK